MMSYGLCFSLSGLFFTQCEACEVIHAVIVAVVHLFSLLPGSVWTDPDLPVLLLVDIFELFPGKVECPCSDCSCMCLSGCLHSFLLGIFEGWSLCVTGYLSSGFLTWWLRCSATPGVRPGPSGPAYFLTLGLVII